MNNKVVNTATLIADRVAGVGVVDKQNGGSGQFARVEITIAPGERGGGVVFRNEITGGVLSRAFALAAENGVRAEAARGALAGFPVTDIVVSLTGGKTHTVDSNDQAFTEAGRLAFADACAKAEMTILEPVATLQVDTPHEYVGAILGDLARRRGQITGQDTVTGAPSQSVVRATVSLGEMFGYTTDLRSLTQGRASFTLTPTGYAEAPSAVVQALVAATHGQTRPAV